jgi:hypothetical protein
MFGPKTDEALKGCIQFHNEKLHNLCSPNTVRMIRSKIMRGEGQLLHTREKQSAYKVLEGMPEGKNLLGVDGRITLKWILKK